MVYKVLDVARYIINYSNDNNYEMSNLKLQKILYFVQARFLVDTEKPCFEEDIEAWDFGVVIPEVYHEFRIYGGSWIPKINEYIDISDIVSELSFRQMINPDGTTDYTLYDYLKEGHQKDWYYIEQADYNEYFIQDHIECEYLKIKGEMKK